MSHENAKIAHRWFEEVWNKKRLSAIDEMADPKAVGQGQQFHDGLINLEEFRAFAAHLQSAFPDLRMTIDDTIAEGDRVALRWQLQMTHTGQFLRYPPTNKKVSVSGITILRMADGKLVAGWDKWDQLGLLEQIGGSAGAGPEAGTSGLNVSLISQGALYVPSIQRGRTVAHTSAVSLSC